MSPYDLNDISRSRCAVIRFIQKRCVWIFNLAFSNTTLEAEHPGRGVPSDPLRRRQGLTEYSSRPRL